MPIAVGVIETQRFPTVLAAADAMVKAGRVTIVVQDRSESGCQFVAVRGLVSEVKRAVEAGIVAGNALFGEGTVTNHDIVPNPSAHLDGVLPMDYADQCKACRV